jgi:hypothetical protein
MLAAVNFGNGLVLGTSYLVFSGQFFSVQIGGRS